MPWEWPDWLSCIVEQRCYGRALRTVAAKWDLVSPLIFSMPQASKIKKNHSLSPPHLCQTQLLRSAVISRALLSSCKPGWPTPSTHKGTHGTALPTTPYPWWSYTQGCPHMATWLYKDLALQRTLSLAWQVGVESSWLLRENFSCVISSSVVPTAKIQSIEVEGFKIGIHTKIHWLFYRIIITV